MYHQGYTELELTGFSVYMGAGMRDVRGFSGTGGYENAGDMRRAAPLPPGPPPGHPGPAEQGSLGPPQRKKLVLKPRSVTADVAQENVDEGASTKPDPFGGARANDPNKFFQKKEEEEKASKVLSPFVLC